MPDYECSDCTFKRIREHEEQFALRDKRIGRGIAAVLFVIILFVIVGIVNYRLLLR